MKKYYLMAIDKCYNTKLNGDIQAINRLGKYYKSQKDYDNMKKYFLMAIDKGDTDAMYSLGSYYKEIENNNAMMYKYFTMCTIQNQKELENIMNKN